MSRFHMAALPALFLSCTHGPTPEQAAMIKRGDCKELLLAADGARAKALPDLAGELASGCSQDRFAALVDKSEAPEALLWCGRAKAAAPLEGKPACDPKRISELASHLNPHLTLGPPDEGTVADPVLLGVLETVGKDLNLSWDAEEPDVMVGKLNLVVDHLTSSTVATVTDAKGNKQRVPATQHRFVAKADAQVELGGKTRVLRASEEARDLTWNAVPRQGVAAKPEPAVPSEDELKKRGATAWVRALAKALAAAPPEAVNVSDARGCVAYGLSLNMTSGDSGAAASGSGDPAKIAACETLLGEPAGAGVPVP
jgi:hypothetical protein